MELIADTTRVSLYELCTRLQKERLVLSWWDFPKGDHYQIGIDAPDLTSNETTPYLRFSATSTGASQAYYSYYYSAG